MNRIVEKYKALSNSSDRNTFYTRNQTVAMGDAELMNKVKFNNTGTFTSKALSQKMGRSYNDPSA